MSWVLWWWWCCVWWPPLLYSCTLVSSPAIRPVQRHPERGNTVTTSDKLTRSEEQGQTFMFKRGIRGICDDKMCLYCMPKKLNSSFWVLVGMVKIGRTWNGKCFISCVRSFLSPQRMNRRLPLKNNRIYKEKQSLQSPTKPWVVQRPSPTK